ncbi:MAG: DoxX family protein [Saccharopolyspora sp.]|nr:DoxX family protein [Saccharopolyspora sp.]
MRHLRDLLTFIARLAIGIVLIAHGAQKVCGIGMPTVVDAFRQIGIPLPSVAAWFTAMVELVGGLLLILGLLLPLVGICIAIVMAGAIFFVHAPYGLFSPQGYELVLVIGVSALMLGFNGGRWAIDHGLFSQYRKRKVRVAEQPTTSE